MTYLPLPNQPQSLATKLLAILRLTLLIVIGWIGTGTAQGHPEGHKHALEDQVRSFSQRHPHRYSGRHPRRYDRFRQGRRSRYYVHTWSPIYQPARRQRGGTIFGQVTFVEGDMMPSPERQPEGQKAGGQPVRRQIGIFRLTTFAQTQPGVRTGFFATMGSRPLLTTWSAKDGTYRLRLRPGTYTVCVRETGQWYANLSDHLGQINPVQVLPDSTTHHDLLINYKAVY